MIYIALPAYNEAVALPLLIARIATVSQQYFNNEIRLLIADDGSKDGTADAARQAAAVTRVTYPLLLDLNEQLQSDLGITGLPATLFVDSDGKILERHSGALDATALTQTIGRLYDIA